MKRWKHEESIRNKFEDYQPPVDSEALWESVRHEVPRKKRRRAAFILLGLAGAMVMGILAGQFIDLGSAEVTAETPDNVSTTIEPSRVANDKLRSTQASPTSKQSNEAEILSATTISPIATQIQLPAQKPSASITTSSNTDNYESTALTATEVNQSTFIQDLQVETTLTKNKTQYQSSIETLTPVESLPFDLLTHTPPSPFADHIAVKEIKPIPARSIGLMIYSGAGATSSTFRNHESQDYFDAAFDAITNLPTIELGISCTIPLGNKWRIQPGIRYMRLSTRLDWTSDLEDRITQPGVQRITVDENGQTESISGIIGATSINRSTGEYYTSIHQLGVDIHVAYLLWHAPKFRLYAFAGGTAGTTMASSGSFPGSEGQLTPWTRGDNPYKGISLGAGAGISMEYYVSPSFAFTLTPNINYTQLTFDNNNIAFDQGFTIAGCRLGALIQL